MPEIALDEARMRQALKGRRILLTGHTGFKGGWLALWLRRLGAETAAVALLPGSGGPSMFEAAGVANLVNHRVADITDPRAFEAAIADIDAELVIHMAAQALVRPSYDRPLDTFRTNVIGTAAVLDAARAMPSLRGVIVVTSDKCYENNEWTWGYRERDPMGGADPYSASKGCAELVVAAYRRSFFAGRDAPPVVSVRAGNVFGGGDWAVDRLVPDIVRAAIARTPVAIRNPHSVRPWQHVLEPLAGYLAVATRMLEGRRDLADAYNFGPDHDGVVDVATLADGIRQAWGQGGPAIEYGTIGALRPEAGILRLDSTRARVSLGWRPRLSIDAAISLTVDWYRSHAVGGCDMRALSEAQIDHYVGRPVAMPVREPLSFSEAATCA